MLRTRFVYYRRLTDQAGSCRGPGGLCIMRGSQFESGVAGDFVTTKIELPHWDSWWPNIRMWYQRTQILTMGVGGAPRGKQRSGTIGQEVQFYERK
jgi:hypothetical protein